jgi:hypothetical protein
MGLDLVKNRQRISMFHRGLIHWGVVVLRSYSSLLGNLHMIASCYHLLKILMLQLS